MSRDFSVLVGTCRTPPCWNKKPAVGGITAGIRDMRQLPRACEARQFGEVQARGCKCSGGPHGWDVCGVPTLRVEAFARGFCPRVRRLRHPWLHRIPEHRDKHPCLERGLARKGMCSRLRPHHTTWTFDHAHRSAGPSKPQPSPQCFYKSCPSDCVICTTRVGMKHSNQRRRVTPCCRDLPGSPSLVGRF